ncbi:MAG: hypothetical protein BIFFINMI_01322 [Phycisphaerae bacterium]|nr:hypothetical protein [Phycisphaerae bacterium]
MTAQPADFGVPDRRPCNRARAWRQSTWTLPAVVGGGIALLAAGELIGLLWALGLGICVLCLAGLLLCAAWVKVAHAAIRRRDARRRWLPLSVATACWLAPLGVGYFAWWQPTQALHDWNAIESESPAELRELCHRSMLWDIDPHDQFVHLRSCGDASSAPRIIWAMRWMPAADVQSCTWNHATDALRFITNQSSGASRSDWARWYRDNRDRTQLQWWIDGFTAEGYSISAGTDKQSVLTLLAVVGRVPAETTDLKPWLTHNAWRMLDRLAPEPVEAAILAALVDGTPAQRLGADRYTRRRRRAAGQLSLCLPRLDRSIR